MTGRKSLILFLLILLIPAGAILLAPGEEESPVRSDTSSQEPGSSSSLRLTDILYTRTRGEHTLLNITASSAEYRDDPRTASLYDVRARVYPRSGGLIQLFSPLGTYDLEQETLTLPSGVTAATRDGFRISADRGHYRHRSEEIGFESGVEVSAPNFFAWGKQVSLSIENGILVAEEGIEAHLAPAQIRELLHHPSPPETAPSTP